MPRTNMIKKFSRPFKNWTPSDGRVATIRHPLLDPVFRFYPVRRLAHVAMLCSQPKTLN